MNKSILSAVCAMVLTGCASTPDITVEKTTIINNHSVTALYDSNSGEFYRFKESLINKIDFEYLLEVTTKELQPIIDKGICGSLTEPVQTYLTWGAKLSCNDDGSMYASFRDHYKSAYMTAGGAVWGNAPAGTFSVESMKGIIKAKKDLSSQNFYE